MGLVLILASMSWCFFILDIVAEALSFYSLDLLFSKPTGELLLWWQMLFRFLILVGIIMLIIGLSVSVMGAISLAEIYILCYLLKQHDLRFIFDGVQDIKYFRKTYSEIA